MGKSIAIRMLLLLVLFIFGCSEEKQPGRSPDNTTPRERFVNMMSHARIGAVVDMVTHEKAAKEYPEGKLLGFDTPPDMILGLQNDKTDVAYASYSTVFGYLKNHRQTFVAVPEPADASDVGFALRKDNTGLLAKIDAVLKQYHDSGLLKKLEAEWYDLARDDYPRINVPERGEDAPVLRAAIAIRTEPLLFMEDGRPSGMDIELIKRVAYDLGMRCELLSVKFGALIPAIESGRADVAVGGIFITPERAEKVAFTRPYLQTQLVALVRKSFAERFSYDSGLTFSDLAGRKIGVLTGSIYDRILSGKIPGATIEYYDDYSPQIAALKGGKISAFVCEEPGARQLMKTHPELYMIDGALGEEAYCFAFNREKGVELCREINAFLETLERTGKLKELHEKWLNGDEAGQVIPELFFPDEGRVLRVVGSGEMPFTYIKNGKLAGYELEILSFFAHAKGWRLHFSELPIAARLSSLSAGKMDIVCGGISATAEREKSMMFSRPAMTGPIRLVALKPQHGDTGKSSFFPNLKESFKRTLIVEGRWRMILHGLGMTLLITAASAVIGTLLAFPLCFVRRGKFAPGVWASRNFISLIQGTPMVVLLMVLYYVVFGRIDIAGVWVAILAFSINCAVYVAEMLRSGIDGVDPGQLEAASAMGFSRRRVFTNITLPQVVRQCLPVYKGELISLLKGTAVVGYIAIEDLTKMSDIIRSRTYEAFFPLIMTALIYLLAAYLLIWLLSAFEFKRERRKFKGVTEHD